MTLAEPPRAGAISKPHDYKPNVQKMKGLLKKMSFNGEQFENFKPKNPKNPIIVWRTKKNLKTSKAKTEREPCSQEEIHWSKIEKKHSEKNCWNIARLELRSQILICSPFI